MTRPVPLVGLLAALSFIAPPVGRSTTPPVVDPGPMRLVSSSGVRALLPPKWDFRPADGAHRNGIVASVDPTRRVPSDLRHPGLEAYWVDATEVGVPTDYFELAARGPVLDLFRAERGCSSSAEHVATGDRMPTDLHGHPGHYVATAEGTCTRRHEDTRWASLVVAPGFGDVRSLGIPRSGLYVVNVSVRQGPHAEDRLGSLLAGVSFGGTSVSTFMRAAGLVPAPYLGT